MNNRWRKQVKLLKNDIKINMQASAYGEWVQAVCGVRDTSEIWVVEASIKHGEDANDELNNIYKKLELLIPKNKLAEIGNQKFFANFADFIGELSLGNDWHSDRL